MDITNDFFARSKIEPNQDAQDIMDFLSSSENVNKMIVASDMGLPAITPVVAELERRFENCKLFPLNHEGKNQNAANRQNIGRMIKFIMSYYGYIPIAGGLSERARIPKFANSNHFTTAAVYRKLQVAQYNIKVESIKNTDWIKN